MIQYVGIILIIVVVEVLYNVLYRLFTNELLKMNIGYSFDPHTLAMMNDLINAIDYIECGNPKDEEIIKIIQYYEAI